MNKYGVSRLASVGFRPPTPRIFLVEVCTSVRLTFCVAMTLGLVLLAVLLQDLFRLARSLVQRGLWILLEQHGLVGSRIQGRRHNGVDARHRRREAHVRKFLGYLTLRLKTLECRTLAHAVSRRHLPGFRPLR